MSGRRVNSVFQEFAEKQPELKNIFARIPKELREDFDFVVQKAEGQSIYAGVEIACRLLIQRFKEKNPHIKLPSEQKPEIDKTRSA